MRYDQSRYGVASPFGSAVRVDTRDRFLVRTYNHLFGAILLFAGIEFALFKTGLYVPVLQAMSGLGNIGVLLLFVLGSWGASHLAHRVESKPAQYAALGFAVVVWAIMFVPMLYIADRFAPGAIQSAGTVTILGFAALTGLVLWTKKDFSFLRGVLMWGGIAAMLLIVASLIFGFHLGTFFSVAMVAFAGAAILYDTSRVLHDFPEDRYVAASLELFASVAMMFWYVLRLFIGGRRD